MNDMNWYEGTELRFNIDTEEVIVTEKMTKEKSYHIYLEDKVLFKNLERELFEIIWDRIYVSYHKDDLTYEELMENIRITSQSTLIDNV